MEIVNVPIFLSRCSEHLCVSVANQVTPNNLSSSSESLLAAIELLLGLGTKESTFMC